MLLIKKRKKSHLYIFLSNLITDLILNGSEFNKPNGFKKNFNSDRGRQGGFSHRSGRDLLTVAQKCNNIVPIIEDARHPQKYRAVMSMVDCIFFYVAQPDQTRMVALNAHQFLKPKGHVVISIKANCIDSTAPASFSQ